MTKKKSAAPKPQEEQHEQLYRATMPLFYTNRAHGGPRHINPEDGELLSMSHLSKGEIATLIARRAIRPAEPANNGE